MVRAWFRRRMVWWAEFWLGFALSYLSEEHIADNLTVIIRAFPDCGWKLSNAIETAISRNANARRC